MSHTVLMGDPTHFSVIGGANPHTRDHYGRRKSVDRELAIRQWRGLHDLLSEHNLRIEVVPPNPKLPGLVYPANAGFRLGDDFILSNLTPTRAAEQPSYRRSVEALGLRCHEIQSRFEGEADLFPAGDLYLFTHGQIQRQRFVPRLGWPPWRRIYGFRSEPVALDEMEAIHPLRRSVLQVLLRDERFYHGDTCLCSFGPGRQALLAYLPVLAPHSAEALQRAFGERLISLEDDDAAIYAANSFSFERKGKSFLVMPAGISARLEEAVRAQDTLVLKIDVSEFHKKGGGSVKCMIGDLGKIPEASLACTD
ncbi:MAG: arginine deiminase-related protein [Deltaproteobacteria bacterium]|nr:arginine deiminase-related protein [Deltaproteobacteria bacterium]